MNKVGEKCERFMKKYGWSLEPHSVEEVDEFNRRLKLMERRDPKHGAYFDDSDLTPAMHRFIQNERALCAFSCEYFLTRYFWLTETDIQHFAFRSGQRAFFSVLQQLEDLGVAQLVQVLKARKQGLCLHPDTRVLTADLRWIPISAIRNGDDLLGVDESPVDKERKMRHSSVEAVREVYEEAYKLKFDDGTEIIATGHHRFLCKRVESSTDTIWKEVRNFKIGQSVRWITSPWGEPNLEDAWYGGLMDGEGTVRQKTRAGCEMTLSQIEGTVLSRAEDYLKNLGYTYRKEWDMRAVDGKTPTKGNHKVGRLVVGRMSELMRLLGQCRPCRFRKDWWDGKGIPGKKVGNCWRKVVSIDLLPKQRMIDLQTSTKTFIAEGLVSHNSTIAEGLMTHAALMIPGTRCSIGSADDQKTQVMMGMMYGALQHIPWWLSPAQTRDKRSGRAMLEFQHIGSMIVVQHGAMRGGIGQGTTPNKVHLSEVCDYTDPVAQIEEGLLKAVPLTSETLMVFESTGNGNTGWWAEQWRSNKEKFWLGRAEMLPLFLPWFMTPELYPHPDWVKKFPFPAGWKRGETRDVKAMIDKCELYVKSTEILTRILGKNWRLPDEQVWYWQFKFEEAKGRRQEKSWLRQLPCDDIEALIGEHDSVYSHETIAEIQTTRERETEIFGILGGGINEKHDPSPDDVDYQKPRITVNWEIPNSLIPIEWMLMPLKGDTEHLKFDPMKKLIVYKRPQKGRRYSIAVDPGTGVGGDRTVIEVSEVGNKGFCDIQVAEFASDDIDNVEVFAFVACIAAWYGQYYDDGETVKMAIEQKRKYGDSCYHALKLHGFRNWHKFRMYDKKTLRERPSVNPREGWFTNEWSRPMLLNAFKFAVDNGWYKVNSRWLLEEMEGHEQRITEGGKTRADHARGKHDDRIFSAAIGYFIQHDLDVLMEREHVRCNIPKTGEEWVVNTSPCLGPVIENIEAERFVDLYAG